MLLTPQSAWPRYVAWIRVALAACAPAATYILTAGASPIYYGVMAAYLIYALAVALRGKSFSGMLGLLALFGDTVFFLIVASYGAGHMIWVASALYLFLLGEALTFYSTVEVVVIVAVCALFCAILPDRGAPLERTVIVGGAVACAFAISKRQLQSEVERLREKLSEAEKAADKARELERVRRSEEHTSELQSQR